MAKKDQDHTANADKIVKKPLELSRAAKRRVKLTYEAFQEEPDDREMLFQAAAMCQVYLPKKGYFIV